jgi:hypothetical protein
MRGKLLAINKTQRVVLVDMPEGVTSAQIAAALNAETATQTCGGFRQDGVFEVTTVHSRVDGKPFWYGVSVTAEDEAVEADPSSCHTPLTPQQRIMLDVRTIANRAAELLNNGDAQHAHQLLTGAKPLLAMAGSPEDDGYMWFLSVLAGTQYAVGYKNAGADSDAKAIEIALKLYGPDDARTIVILDNHAENLIMVKEYVQAELLLIEGVLKLEALILKGEGDVEWLKAVRNDAAKNLEKILAATGRATS